MLVGLLMLAVVIFGLNVLFGRGKVEDYYKFLIWLILAPILLAIGRNHIVWFWVGLPRWGQLLVLLIFPVIALSTLRFLLPNAQWFRVLQDSILAAAIFLATFPFRFIWRAGRYAFRREHGRPDLVDAYRPAVGGKPPLKRSPGTEKPK